MAGSVPKELIMTTETNSNRPTHRVYAVIKKEGREKGTWLEIGAAWPHRDGKGYGVTLNFIPRSPDAELVIRAIEPTDRRTGRRLGLGHDGRCSIEHRPPCSCVGRCSQKLPKNAVRRRRFPAKL